jgi:phage terminase small subunit
MRAHRREFWTKSAIYRDCAMGVRGPLPRRAKSAQRGPARLRRLPADADGIRRRLLRDIAGLTPADVALVEDTARWAAIGAAAYSRLAEEDGTLALTVTDTAHGSGEETRKNPLLIVLRTASEQLRANAQQLGATPLARARMPEPEEEEQSLADILFADVSQEAQ